jgi:hypothetical protein
MRAKHIIGDYERFLEGLFDTQIFLSAEKSNFGAKKDKSLSKYIEISQIIQKILHKILESAVH